MEEKKYWPKQPWDVIIAKKNCYAKKIIFFGPRFGFDPRSQPHGPK